MNKKGAEMGEVIVWLLRIVMISVLAVGIRTFMHTNSQYYESENAVFFRRILFSSESFLDYQEDYKQQNFYIVNFEELEEGFIDEALDRMFYSDDDIGIRVSIDCEDEESYVGYYNQDFYRSRKWFSLNYFVDDITYPILCKKEENNYKYFTEGLVTIEIVSRFEMGTLSSVSIE